MTTHRPWRKVYVYNPVEGDIYGLLNTRKAAGCSQLRHFLFTADFIFRGNRDLLAMCEITTQVAAYFIDRVLETLHYTSEQQAQFTVCTASK